MALYTTKGASNIPIGAIKVSKESALNHQKQLIKDWEKNSDVFFLRYGRYFASGVTFFTSFFVIKHYRRQFYLADRPLITAFLSISSIASLLIFQKFESTITNNTLIMKMKCPLCTQLRYVLQQTSISVVYPSITSCILFSFIATKKKLGVVPDYEKNYKDYFRTIFNFTTKGSLMFRRLLTLNLFVSFFLPYMQRVELTNITQLLRELEEIERNTV